MITVVYLTCRKYPKIEWFFSSLCNQLLEQPVVPEIKVVIVDHWAEAYGQWTEMDVAKRKYEFSKMAQFPIHHVPPKPTVWAGKYRLTTQNYFAPSNSRNTGLCMAPDGYIVYVDDLSVLLDGWLQAVLDAQKGGYIACGTYQKVLKLNVVDGRVVGFEDHPSGHDSRKASFTSQDPFVCAGSWMFGCSAAIPVEALLKINGWDENSDSSGGEDYLCGIMLQRGGSEFRMCPKMGTFESEEFHHIEVPFKRIIKPKPGFKDSSWCSLNAAQNGDPFFPNYQSMKETREIVLNGGSFPIIQCPQHDWRDGALLSTM